MQSQCERCKKWVTLIFTTNYGPYWKREMFCCFDCLSEHDQDKIRLEGGKVKESN